MISQEELLKLNGDRIEYPIQTEGAFTKRASRLPPKLTLRVRKATPSDVHFMKQLFKIKSKSSKSSAVYLEESFVAPNPSSVNMLKRESKKTDDGRKLVREHCVILADCME